MSSIRSRYRSLAVALALLVVCGCHNASRSVSSEGGRATAHARHWIAEDRWPAPGAVSAVYGFEGWDGDLPVFSVEVFDTSGASSRSYNRVEIDDRETRWTPVSAPFAPHGDPDGGDRPTLSAGAALIVDGEIRSSTEALSLKQPVGGESADGDPARDDNTQLPTKILLRPAISSDTDQVLWQGDLPKARIWSVTRSPDGVWLLIEVLAADQTHYILTSGGASMPR